MPQATDELHNAMKKMFGDPVEDSGPMKFLQDRGWVLTRAWERRKPSTDHIPTAEEYACVDFLFQEWDFGGVAA